MDKPRHNLTINKEEVDLDGLNYLAGETVDFVNTKAFEGTLLAHTDGEVPNFVVEVPELDAYTFGYLVYFFEKAVAISGYLNGVNPFDQPGVEAYKANMFALLGKPGFEDKSRIRKTLKRLIFISKPWGQSLQGFLFVCDFLPLELPYS